MKKIHIIMVVLLATVLVGCGKKEDNQSKLMQGTEMQERDDNTGVDEANNIEIINALDSSEAQVSQAPGTIDDAEESSDMMVSADEVQANYDRRVICWGTSLTYGTGGEGVTMPGVLGTLSGANVMNYGGYAENTNCIATRSGASKLTLTEGFTIPSDTNPVPVEFETEFGEIALLLVYTDSGLNPVTIDGVKGKLSIDEELNHYFNRFEPGEGKKIEAGTQIIPYSVEDMQPDDIQVIWTAGNDNLQNTEGIEHLIEKIDKMIEFSGSDKYVIVSEMNLHEEVPVTDEVNEMFEDYYKEHFVHLRRYFMEDAFAELGMYPSEEDKVDIENGEIPRYFRIDEVHGNSLYYLIAGQQVYKKCQELGYLE